MTEVKLLLEEFNKELSLHVRDLFLNHNYPNLKTKGNSLKKLDKFKKDLIKFGLCEKKYASVFLKMEQIIKQPSIPVGTLMNFRVTLFHLFPLLKALKYSSFKIKKINFKEYFKNRNSLDKLIDKHVFVGIVSVTILNLYSPTIATFLFVIYNILSVMVMSRLLRPKEVMLNMYYLVISIYSVLAFTINYLK